MIYVSYISAVLAMCLLDDQEATQYDSIIIKSAYSGLTMCVLAIMLYTDSHRLLFMHSCAVLTVGLYRLLFDSSSIIAIIVDAMQTTLYMCLRYAMLYKIAVERIKSLDDATTHLPYYAVLSNTANVIEFRRDVLIDAVPEFYRNVMWVVLSLISIASALISRGAHVLREKNVLFESRFRLRRAAVQSSIFGCGLLCYTGLMNNLTLHMEYLQDKRSTMEFTMTIGVLPLFFLYINRWMFRKLSYIVYTILSPVILLAASIYVIVRNSHMQHIECAILVIISTCTYFLIFDPARFMLYICHKKSQSSRYIACDTAAMCLVFAIVPLISSHISMYINIAACVIWIMLCIYSTKYHANDNKCSHCIFVIENSHDEQL